MPYGLLGDIVIFIHFLWIVFLIVGAFIGRSYKWVKRIHIAGLGFALIIQGFEWYCSLTYLEVWLRKKQDPSLVYSGSFIAYYIEKIIYIDLPPHLILILTITLILISACLYLHKPCHVDRK